VNPDPIRLAIVGAGEAVRSFHAPALKALTDQFRVTMVCSRTITSASRLAPLVDAGQVTADLDEVLARQDVEAVLIAVPICLNLPFAARSLRAGKHVLLEKPLAGTLSEGQELLQVSKQQPHLTAMVAENFRYAPAVNAMKDLVGEGAIGLPEFAYCHSIGHIDPTRQRQWRAQPQHSGGYLMDGGVHYAALLRIILGEIRDVAAVARLFDPRLGGAIGLSAHLCTEQGVQVMYNFLRTPAPVGPWSAQLHIFGAQGTASMDAQGTITMQAAGRAPTRREAPGPPPHLAQLLDFFAAIRLGNPPRSTFDEGWRDMQWVDRALSAADANRSPTSSQRPDASSQL
jgi:predicted dehydrogenase